MLEDVRRRGICASRSNRGVFHAASKGVTETGIYLYIKMKPHILAIAIGSVAVIFMFLSMFSFKVPFLTWMSVGAVLASGIFWQFTRPQTITVRE